MSTWDHMMDNASSLVIDALDDLRRGGLELNAMQRGVPVVVRAKLFLVVNPVYWPDMTSTPVDYIRCQDTIPRGRLTMDGWLFDLIDTRCKTPGDYLVILHNVERAITWCESRLAGLTRAQEHILAGQVKSVEEIQARIGLNALEKV